MATKLNKQLKREIDVEGKPFMVTLSPEGLKLTEKGKRLGRELTWKDLGIAAAEILPGELTSEALALLAELQPFLRERHHDSLALHVDLESLRPVRLQSIWLPSPAPPL